MKKTLIIPLLFAFCSANTQVSGNVNYLEQVDFKEIQINIPESQQNKMQISIKGLANVKADNYVALFSLTQVGKSMKQTDSLFNKRLSRVKENMKSLDSVNLFVDMVSFIPLYDIVLEKKLFSKDSYNEIPDGFEMKKNLHIHYKDASQLSQIISICAEAEIYNLIQVNYFSKQLDAIRLQLQQEAKKKLNHRLTHYVDILGADMEQFTKQISDGYKVEYPTERYQNCIAYSNNSFKYKPLPRGGKDSKNQASYYDPIVNKEFDFVLNPVIVEPVIQVMYELKLSFFKTPLKSKEKQLVWVTPGGELKPLTLP